MKLTSLNSLFATVCSIKKKKKTINIEENSMNKEFGFRHVKPVTSNIYNKNEINSCDIAFSKDVRVNPIITPESEQTNSQ